MGYDKVHRLLSWPVPLNALWTQKQLKESWNVTNCKTPNCIQPLERLDTESKIPLIFKPFLHNKTCFMITRAAPLPWTSQQLFSPSQPHGSQ